MNMRSIRLVPVLATLVCVGAGGLRLVAQATAPAPAPPPPATSAAPQGSSAAGTPFEPVVGQAGKDVVWVPTSEALVNAMLSLAKLTPDDYVIDLGSGDGRTIIAAAKRGARGHGVEFNPDMVALSNRLAREAGVSDRANFLQGDMYEADISKATVMALFLLPHNLERLKDKILALPPGTRMVMNTFTLPGWEADETVRLETDCQSWCTALLHIVPAKVDGRWRIEGGGELVLGQDYQKVTGTLTGAGATPETVSGRLNGALVTLTAAGTNVAGRVEGNRISGVATGTGGASRPWVAVRAVN